MYLLELLIPAVDRNGAARPHQHIVDVRTELLVQFGGVTPFNHAPGTGLWTDPDGGIVRDDVVVYEVMARSLDR
ncbi:MAG: hypothetical protein ABI661_00925 [Gammaproteobacteria bacterium]